MLCPPAAAFAAPAAPADPALSIVLSTVLSTVKPFGSKLVLLQVSEIGAAWSYDYQRASTLARIWTKDAVDALGTVAKDKVQSLQ